MAKRDFDRYYLKVASQLKSLQEVFDDIADEVSNDMVEPERLEQIEATIKPIKESFQTLSYIKYLLDMPTNARKKAKYSRQSQNLLCSAGKHTGENTIQQNSSILADLRK